jgi:hypothetical protein
MTKKCPNGEIFDSKKRKCRVMNRDENNMTDLTRLSFREFINYNIGEPAHRREYLIDGANYHGQALQIRKHMDLQSAVDWNREHPKATQILLKSMRVWDKKEIENALDEELQYNW